MRSSSTSLRSLLIPYKANQQKAQQELRIDGWATSFAIAVLQSLAHEAEVDMLIN
jgi:hypothetical protein